MIRLFLQTQLACRENAAPHADLSNHNYYFRDECHTREKTSCQGSKLKDACSLTYIQFITIGLLYNRHSDVYKRHVLLIIWTIATFCSKVSVSHDLWNGIQPSLFFFDSFASSNCECQNVVSKKKSPIITNTATKLRSWATSISHRRSVERHFVVKRQLKALQGDQIIRSDDEEQWSPGEIHQQVFDRKYTASKMFRPSQFDSALWQCLQWWRVI